MNNATTILVTGASTDNTTIKIPETSKEQEQDNAPRINGASVKHSESAPQLLCHGNYPTTNMEHPEVGERNVQKPRSEEVNCR